MAVKGDAALIYTHPVTGQQVVHRLGAPLSTFRPRIVQRRYVRHSLDRTVRDVVTIGPPVYELVARIRFDALPNDLLELLNHGANGVPVTYLPSLSGHTSYDATIVLDDDVIALDPDRDRWVRGEYEFATLLLRRSTPWGELLGGDVLLFRYVAGQALPPGATFSRSSPAWHVGRDGVLRQAAANVPRVEWLDLDGDGVREIPALLLESSATNHVSSTTVHEAAQWGWSNPGPGRYRLTALVDNPAFSTLYPGQIGLYSAAAGETVTASAWVETNNLSLQFRVGGFSSTAPTVRSNGRQVITITHSNPWQYRVSAYAPENVRPNIKAGDYIEFIFPQIEPGPVESSPILTSGAPASRSADVLTFPWAHAPGPYTGYLRFIELGALAYSDTRVLLQIGTSGVPPWLYVRKFTGTNRYGIGLNHGAGAASSNLPTSPVPTIGDQVELLWRLYADGSVQIEQAINGGTPVVAARSAAVGLPTAWSGQVMRLSGLPSGGSEAPAAWRDAIVLRGSHWTMEQVREVISDLDWYRRRESTIYR